jgi:hypothetical protein
MGVHAIEAARDRTKIVAEARGETSAATPERWSVAPWDTVINTAELVAALRDTFMRYIIMPVHAAIAMALWTLHAWALDAAYVSPFLTFSSPEMRCGKSTALAVLYRVGPRTAIASNISPRRTPPDRAPPTRWIHNGPGLATSTSDGWCQ